MLEKVNGKKTYLVAGATALYGILGFALGYLDVQAALEMVLAAGAMVGFRSALNK